jgi:PD-(D/E)XK nuclease superfamily
MRPVLPRSYDAGASLGLRRLTSRFTMRGVELDVAYRLDLLVEETVMVEVKAVDQVTPTHVAQLLSYLRLSGKRVGLLLNFKVVNLRRGIRRVINGYSSPSERCDLALPPTIADKPHP